MLGCIITDGPGEETVPCPGTRLILLIRAKGPWELCQGYKSDVLGADGEMGKKLEQKVGVVIVVMSSGLTARPGPALDAGLCVREAPACKLLPEQCVGLCSRPSSCCPSVGQRQLPTSPLVLAPGFILLLSGLSIKEN